MENTGLSKKKCEPCEGGTMPLSHVLINEFLENVSGWNVRESQLHKTYSFSNFKKSMRFVNQVAELAESEGHHPDIEIHYNRVDIILWTHSVNGLSENDFIVAAKIDEL